MFLLFFTAFSKNFLEKDSLSSNNQNPIFSPQKENSTDVAAYNDDESRKIKQITSVADFGHDAIPLSLL